MALRPKIPLSSLSLSIKGRVDRSYSRDEEGCKASTRGKKPQRMAVRRDDSKPRGAPSLCD